MPANDLNHAVIQLGTLRGAFLWRNNTGRRGGVSFGKVGSGDVIGVYRGYFVSEAVAFFEMIDKAIGES
jgi:hypothetical protein